MVRPRRGARRAPPPRRRAHNLNLVPELASCSRCLYTVCCIAEAHHINVAYTDRRIGISKYIRRHAPRHPSCSLLACSIYGWLIVLGGCWHARRRRPRGGIRNILPYEGTTRRSLPTEDTELAIESIGFRSASSGQRRARTQVEDWWVGGTRRQRLPHLGKIQQYIRK